MRRNDNHNMTKGNGKMLEGQKRRAKEALERSNNDII